MANPEHRAVLDTLDRFTVRAYRVGHVGISVSLGGMAIFDDLTQCAPSVWGVALVWSVGLAVLNLHLYMKGLRWLVPVMAWTGALIWLGPGYDPVGEGLIFACISALCLKEWICFRVPLLRWTPVFLIIAVFATWLNMPLVARPMLLLTSLICAALSVAKWRMPLDFDIGDKSAYQI